MLKTPPELKDMNTQDLTNYEQILKQTNVVTNPRNDVPGSRPYQTNKFKFVIKELLSLKEQHGHGIYFLPGDIKGLENKLEILLGEYRAGNRTSTRNEIIPIADELLRRKAISRREYRDINTFLSESLS